ISVLFTLSLHDALPILTFSSYASFFVDWRIVLKDKIALGLITLTASAAISTLWTIDPHMSLYGTIKCPAGLLVYASYLVLYLSRSEEHTSELQSRFDLV